MNANSLRQRLSLRNIGPSLQRVVLRFPLAVGFLCCLTFLLSYFVVTDTEMVRGTLCLTVFLSVGIFISIAASLWGEEHTDKRLRWAVEGISLTLWGGYCVLLFMTDIIPDQGLPAFYIGHAAWIVAIGGFLLFGSFLKEKDNLKAWHFLYKLAAVSAAKAAGTALIVSSQGNQVAFVLDDFDLTAYSDSTLYLQYDGWLFSKD